MEQAPPSPSRPRRHPAVPLRPCRHRAAPASFGNQSGPHLVGRWIKYSDGAIAAFVQPSLPPCGCCRPRLAFGGFVRPSVPLCDPRRLLAGLAAFMRPSPPSCGPRRLHAALASFVRPSPPSCDPRRLHTAIAVFVRPLPHLSSQRSRRREAGRPLADARLILVPSLVLAEGTEAEQIDETDIGTENPPNCLGGIREFNCACLIVSRLLALLRNTTIQFTLLVYYFLVFYTTHLACTE